MFYLVIFVSAFVTFESFTFLSRRTPAEIFPLPISIPSFHLVISTESGLSVHVLGWFHRSGLSERSQEMCQIVRFQIKRPSISFQKKKVSVRDKKVLVREFLFFMPHKLWVISSIWRHNAATGKPYSRKPANRTCGRKPYSSWLYGLLATVSYCYHVAECWTKKSSRLGNHFNDFFRKEDKGDYFHISVLTLSLRKSAHKVCQH